MLFYKLVELPNVNSIVEIKSYFNKNEVIETIHLKLSKDAHEVENDLFGVSNLNKHNQLSSIKDNNVIARNGIDSKISISEETVTNYQDDND